MPKSGSSIPKYKEAEGALVGELQRLHADIYGNRDLLSYLRNQRTFFSSDDNRESDLMLIDYGDLAGSPKTWSNLIEHFRDKDRRKEFFKEYKEIEMLYEIVSPDAFLRPFLDDYATLSAIYQVVTNTYARRIYVDRAFQKKTNELVQQHIGALVAEEPATGVQLDPPTIETIKQQQGGKATKIINLVKAIQKTAEENSDDPFLVAMAERAKAV